MPDTDDVDPGESPAATEGKETWEPPRIESGQLFEANSLTCTKAAGQGSCQMIGPPFVS